MEKRYLQIEYRDFLSMLLGMEAANYLHWCETCGAWLMHDDPALASTEDFTGCWKAATCDSRYDHLCRSERGALIDEARLYEKEAGTEDR